MQRPTSNAVRAGRSKYSFRAFYITVVLVAALAVLSLVADQSARYRYGVQYGVAQKTALAELDGTRLVKRDEECRLVHHAADKCAFIKANCPEEEAGLFSYLSLYYCNLEKAKPVAFIILALWLGMLFSTIGIAASDFFCINLSTIASILGMSESMAGVTFLAFGNGSPDVFSTFAAMRSHSGSLAVGELIGAAGFITAVVAGSMALVREFKVGKKTFVRDVGFFVVATSFSMIFLADGSLQLWECCVMIGFYVFYVITVVVWHWYLGRRRKRRVREAAARSHYLAPGNEELEVAEEDEDDADAPAGERPHRDAEDFEALERGASPAFGSQLGHDSDEDGDEGIHLAAEMTSSMRVTRPRGPRRNTITPIRPSLVGALEFRSVLSSLQKSRSSHTRPIHLRRYSDDSTAVLNQLGGPLPGSAAPSDFASSVVVTPADALGDNTQPGSSVRTRAVSMNDAMHARQPDPTTFNVVNVPNIGIVAATPTFPPYYDADPGPASTADAAPVSPTLSISPAPSLNHSEDSSPGRTHSRQQSQNRLSLAPPEESFPGARHLRVDYLKEREYAPGSPVESPKAKPRSRPRLQIPNSPWDSSANRTLSPVTQFPSYTDSPLPISGHSSPRSSQVPSLLLPDGIMTSESICTSIEQDQEKPIRWWPYRILPSPYIIKTSLFPTLCTWREKSMWDKFVSIISAPSIFLLAITLPVVEAESQDHGPGQHVLDDDITEYARRERRRSTAPLLTPDSPSLLAIMQPEWLEYRRRTSVSEHRRADALSPQPGEHNGLVGVVISTENLHHHQHASPMPPKTNSTADIEDTSPELARDWNRWLVVMQIFTGPLFVIIIVWANTAEGPDSSKYLVRLILYSLLGSLIAFAVLILTTTPERPPKHRFLLCFVGFVVSIAWISTIANEVVGVLKAFGVILGISDAILGLTIFAVGSSLGDLVADITVARLGYPVMALSACFGGPMLNILLGIGISGLYMTIKEANTRQEKHPSKKYNYKPYQIEVGGSLVVSAIALLVTLVGLLIVVPLNNWIMSRRIGWGLIGLWTAGSIINLAVEVSGGWGDVAFSG